MDGNESRPLALPQSAELAPQPLIGEGFANMQMDEAPRPPRVPAWMNEAKSMGEAQAQTLKTVGTLVDENPKQAALIVRDWLTNAA